MRRTFSSRLRCHWSAWQRERIIHQLQIDFASGATTSFERHISSFALQQFAASWKTIAAPAHRASTRTKTNMNRTCLSRGCTRRRSSKCSCGVSFAVQRVLFSPLWFPFTPIRNVPMFNAMPFQPPIRSATPVVRHNFKSIDELLSPIPHSLSSTPSQRNGKMICNFFSICLDDQQ